ncbi:MAG TPA: TetR/AcrR family transcriptional regulator [Candidatus Stackebrandtia faecavium]|nr:TetR/AcrR family transcriptional regulator [Candidatus Stackebrandtia faecavium]
MNTRAELVVRATDFVTQHGVDNQSLRAIAAAIGTSHRMLIYHFGSRDGLIEAIVDGLWERIRGGLSTLSPQDGEDVIEIGWRFWTTTVEAETLAPMFFELSAPAMRGAPWATAFRSGSEALTAQLASLLERPGLPPAEAKNLARLTMYVVRGAMWELAITQDRASADSAVHKFLQQHWPR